MPRADLHKHTRGILLVAFLVGLVVLAKMLTGQWFPRSGDAFWFQPLLLLVILGSFLLEVHFTRPADVVANGLAVVVTLLAFRGADDRFVASEPILYGGLVLVGLALLAILLVNNARPKEHWRNRLSRVCYEISVFFGQARVLFSVAFVAAAISFATVGSRDFLVLTAFWGLVIVVGPSGIANLLDTLVRGGVPTRAPEIVGNAVAVSQPNVTYVDVFKGRKLSQFDVVALGSHRKPAKEQLGLVLNVHALVDGLRARVLTFSSSPMEVVEGGDEHTIYEAPTSVSLISEATAKSLMGDTLLWHERSRTVGIVRENSDIGTMMFEVVDNAEHPLEEGFLVRAASQDKPVIYQIFNARTKSERLERNSESGAVFANATQLGTWDSAQCGFRRHGWVPALNTPVFRVPADEDPEYAIEPHERVVGFVPGTRYPVVCNLRDLVTHHTAILGITGSGKSWFTYWLIQQLIEDGTKIICLDFTGDYERDLEDLSPVALQATDDEEEMRNHVKTFAEGDDAVAIMDIGEIGQDLDTLIQTQKFIQAVLDYAIEEPDHPTICLVIDEAHTVVPEPATFTGVWGDYGQSKQVVGKISQITLQGRKYRVGFLVIAQRTANVTKTVLSQCNSIVAFNAYDKTGLEFLSNYVGEKMAGSIPNLKEFQALVVGKAFKSRNPLIVQLPTRTSPLGTTG